MAVAFGRLAAVKSISEREAADTPMLTIRNEQMRLFSQEEVTKFEEGMIVHLRKFFPACRLASETTLRELIRYGIERARSYQITARRDVCKYVDLMTVLGRDFDVDERIPWASELLHSERGATRMPRLMNAAQRYLNKPGRASN